jgi:hypothetical protein
VEAVEVHVGAGGAEAAVPVEGEARAIGVFVGVEEDVFAVVLVVTPSRQRLSISCRELAHSLAQRYGTSFSMLDRAQVWRLNDDFWAMVIVSDRV